LGQSGFLSQTLASGIQTPEATPAPEPLPQSNSVCGSHLGAGDAVTQNIKHILEIKYNFS
jgi:hypothetical protein